MRRRRAIAAIGGALLVPAGAWAQEPGRVYRLGVLSTGLSGGPIWAAFFDELRRAGFVEGRNLAVDDRGFELSEERLAVHAAELSAAGVDVILSVGAAAARAAQAATQTIPILSINDFAATLFGDSLARPNANLTGVSILANELNLKRQEILMDLLPQARRMAVMVERNSAGFRQIPLLVEASRGRGVTLTIHEVATSEEMASAVDAARAAGAEALNVLASPRLNANRAAIIARAAVARLPAIYEWPETAAEGGLIGYGASVTALFRQLAGQLVRLLRGTRPADMPIEQATRIVLVINRRTANALGVTIPPTLLVLADEVIE
jgi:putative ABC transport system substrate-binding protein